SVVQSFVRDHFSLAWEILSNLRLRITFSMFVHVTFISIVSNSKTSQISNVFSLAQFAIYIEIRQWFVVGIFVDNALLFLVEDLGCFWCPPISNRAISCHK